MLRCHSGCYPSRLERNALRGQPGTNANHCCSVRSSASRKHTRDKRKRISRSTGKSTVAHKGIAWRERLSQRAFFRSRWLELSTVRRTRRRKKAPRGRAPRRRQRSDLLRGSRAQSLPALEVRSKQRHRCATALPGATSRARSLTGSDSNTHGRPSARRAPRESIERFSVVTREHCSVLRQLFLFRALRKYLEYAAHVLLSIDTCTRPTC